MPRLLNVGVGSVGLHPATQYPHLLLKPADLSDEGVELLAKYPPLIHGTFGNPLRALGCAKIHHVGLMLAYERVLQPVHAGHEHATRAAQLIN